MAARKHPRREKVKSKVLEISLGAKAAIIKTEVQVGLTMVRLAESAFMLGDRSVINEHIAKAWEAHAAAKKLLPFADAEMYLRICELCDAIRSLESRGQPRQAPKRPTPRMLSVDLDFAMAAVRLAHDAIDQRDRQHARELLILAQRIHTGAAEQIETAASKMPQHLREQQQDLGLAIRKLERRLDR